MATKFKINGKNVGKDVTVTIADSLGNQFNATELGIFTHFDIKTDYDLNETKSISNGGQSFFESIPHGIKCTLKFARTNGNLEDLESAYRNASANGVQVSYRLQYQVTNRDGSVNTRNLIEGKPHNWNLGEFGPGAGDVPQAVDLMFPAMQNTGQVSGLVGGAQ